MATKAKMGRPSLFTEELAADICSRLADGESLRDMCEEDGMPHRKTVRAWTYANLEFAARYARAREEGMHSLAEDALHKAKTATQDNAAAARVYVDTVKWFASKMAPAAFGDKLDINQKFEDVTQKSPLDRARRIAFLFARAQREAKKSTGSSRATSSSNGTKPHNGLQPT